MVLVPSRVLSVRLPSRCLEGVKDVALTRAADTDLVTISDNLVIQNQGVGVADSAEGFQGVDGILGIGPVDLTEGTVSDNQPVPTVTDNLYAQGTIANSSIGIFYQPTTEAGALNGSLHFGGVDSSK